MSLENATVRGGVTKAIDRVSHLYLKCMTERYYYAGDQKITLTPSTQVVAVQFSSEADVQARTMAIETTEGVESLQAAEEIEPFGIVLLPIRQSVSEQQAATTLAAQPVVRQTVPVFQMPDGEPDELMIVPPQFRVQFKPAVSEAEINHLNQQQKVEVIAKDDLGPNSYLLRPTSEATQDALDLANLYHESDLTEYAEPDFIYKMKKLADPVNDPFYSQQWALDKMNVPEAWKINQGLSSIKIAILDEGVDINHRDLKDKIVTPYDAVDDDDNQQPNSWDAHGTACAGIAAAMTNNDTGVAGVAPNCKIMPIRIAYSSSPSSNWTTNATWIARGIRKAVDRGADVLSNSWGGGSYSTTIRNAFQYALSDGRGGKGCVTICASGNEDVLGVSYPAKYPECLACGASNQWDERKSKTSLDGENWWGSNYGPELDFVAPGVQIYTTDISGTGGYSSTDYTPRFNGTSSATPNAAGVAGLVLSVDPDLRYWEVADILRLSAKDLGSGGRDDEHGWGRIDAEKALQATRRIWNEVELKVEFLGSGEDCYIRFPMYRLYNSGLNRIRINSFLLRSWNSEGGEIDRFEYIANPGGVMLPGLSPTGGSGHDLKFQGVLLKANGNRSSWSYRYTANWSYTYWRPSEATTSVSAMVPQQEVEQEFEINVEGSGESSITPEIVTEKPDLETVSTNGNGLTQNGSTTQVTIVPGKVTITLD